MVLPLARAAAVSTGSRVQAHVVLLDEELRHQAGRVGGGGGCRLVRG